jgi:type VII secretion-associated serine protease mycosin
VSRHGIHVAATIIALAATTLLTASPAQADKVRSDEWHLARLQIAKAQTISKGGGVVVGVVDSGVYPHKDLQRNLLKGTDVVSGGDSVGHVDQNGHGTEMAGLIAGYGKNAKDGVLGIAPASKILPVKIANPTDNGGTLALGDGIKWAAENGARVINVSAATGPSSSLREGVAAANAADALVVAGTGNSPEMYTFGYPAAMPGVLAVGATDRAGKHAGFSITGPATQICAPGVDIIATEPNNKYVKIEGTSPATAIVSGAAALVRAKFPQLSASEVIHRLTATATDIGKPGRDDECGYGVLNIVKALTADVPPLENSATTPPSASASPAATSPDPAATTPTAEASETTPTSKATVLVVLGVIVVLLAGGLFAFLAVRRRKAP